MIKNLVLVNKFITKNNLLIKLKISSIKIIFYKYKYISNKSNPKTLFNNSSNLSNDISIISKINFPFEFIPFFYGLNLNDFLKFLISMINYDFSQNNFNFDFSQFIKLYSLYKEKQYFYGEKSIFKMFSEKVEEYLAFYWDVKNGKDNQNFLVKIFLPKISIGIGDRTQNFFFCKYFYTMEVDKIVHLMKDNFKLWDFYVMKFFSDFKIFRAEINRILCNKHKNNGYNYKELRLNESYANKIKKIFNFNKINNILKNPMNPINNFKFFYTRKNTLFKMGNESFFFEIEIPKIYINYKYQNNLIDKSFDLSLKKLLQMNKLKKSFELEDLVKFSMVIVDKEEKKKKLIKKLSFFESNKFRRNKKSATISTNIKQIKANIKSNSFKLDKFGGMKNISRNKKKSLIIKNNKENQEIKKDIKLNLDKYIFNFDEDILKFIRKPKTNEEGKNEINNNNLNNLKVNQKTRFIKIIRSVSNKVNNRPISLNKNNIEQTEKKKDINIQIGKMKLIWTEKDLNEYVYIFEEKENQYLLDNPLFIWRDFIQNRFDKFKEKIKKNDYI